jgi:hypothetical protein
VEFREGSGYITWAEAEKSVERHGA